MLCTCRSPDNMQTSQCWTSRLLISALHSVCWREGKREEKGEEERRERGRREFREKREIKHTTHHTPQHLGQPTMILQMSFSTKSVTTVMSVTSVIFMRIYCFGININP